MNLFSFRDREFRVILFFFIISCVHSVGLMIAMIASLLLLKQGVRGAIKALLLIAIRTPLSPAIAVSFGSLQFFKWILIFGFCGVIIVNSGGIPFDRKRRLNTSVFCLTIFCVIAAIGSFMNGSYPVSALFKIISYYIATIAITRGIAATEKPDEYLSFCVMIITPLMLISLPMIPFGKFRLINGSFQGAFNHPNMCGIMCALYISLLVMYKKYFDKGSAIIVVAVLVMLYLSASRTGMITAIICLVIGYKYMFSRNTRFFVFAVGGIALLLMWPSVSEEMNAFLFKTGGNTSILYSRESQMMTFLSKYRAHPLLGSGFAIPYYPGISSYSLDMNLRVEPGNIVWAVLGDCGIIGFITFVIYFLVMTFSQFDYSKITFIVAPLLVSMGEMAFFSVNSIAMLYYVMFGLYMFIEEPYEVNIDEPSSY